jgi:hypothetical protein
MKRPMCGFGPSPTYCDVRDLVAIRGKAKPDADIEVGQILTVTGSQAFEFERDIVLDLLTRLSLC